MLTVVIIDRIPNPTKISRSVNSDSGVERTCVPNQLLSYEVSMSGSTFSLIMNCDLMPPQIVRTITLANNITVISNSCPSNLDFESLYATLSPANTNCQIQIGKNGKTKTITIDNNGNTDIY